MVDHNELIAQFVSVSSATAEQAQFYLEANNWDINVSGHMTHMQSGTPRTFFCTILNQHIMLGCN